MPRKVFVAGEILTAADVNTNLMDQSVMVFDDATARTTAIPTPVEGMVTYLKDTDEVDKFDGSDFVPVGIAPAILQVVSVTKTDFFTTTAVIADVTGLSVSITPTSATSKILVLANIDTSKDATAAGDVQIVLVRDTTPISVGTTATGTGTSTNMTGLNRDNGDLQIENNSVSFLDSPNTTSSVTYKWRVGMGTGDATAMVNRKGRITSQATASTITLMEVAG